MPMTAPRRYLGTIIKVKEDEQTRDVKAASILERFSIECRKTKTRVITLANRKGHR